MITAEELAKWVAEKLDAEVVGDYDIDAQNHGGDTVAVWVDHQTEDEGTTFLITVSEESV